jgi:hypothetical protein
MTKILSSLIVAAFALVAVAPASAAITPRVAGESQIVDVATQKKAKKQTAKKKAPAKKQVAKKAKKSAPAA